MANLFLSVTFSICMVVSLYGGYDYVVMIGKSIIQVYGRHASVWLSRKLDMETSSFPHLSILDSQVQKP